MSGTPHSQPRQQYYKNKANTTESLRKKRQESNVQLRKVKRDEQMLKRRNINVEDYDTDPLKDMNFQDNSCVMMQLPDILVGIMNDRDPEKQFLCTQNARKILSRERNPPIDKMVETNVLAKLVEFLEWDHNPDMQYEASWVLTNIASGDTEQTTAVARAGAVPKLIKLLYNQNRNVVEQAVWTLGNIAGDGACMRDHVLENGIIDPLIALVSASEEGTFLQNLAWTLSNLCRNKNPHTPLQYLLRILPTIAKMLFIEDVQVKTDVCWALSYVTDGPNERIDLVLNSGVLEELTQLLGRTADELLLTPVLRVIGNIVTGSDKQTQRVIDLGVLGHFKSLLTHKRANIQKESAWTLSNITAGTQSQIQAIIDAGILPYLTTLLIQGDYKTQKEACWAVSNFTSGATPEQIHNLVKSNAIEGLCGMLRVKDAKTIQICLEGISNMLKASVKFGETEAMCLAIEECGGVDSLEDLQGHSNEAVYRMALYLIDVYFAAEIDQIGDVAPQTAENGSCFAFGSQQAEKESNVNIVL